MRVDSGTHCFPIETTRILGTHTLSEIHPNDEIAEKRKRNKDNREVLLLFFSLFFLRQFFPVDVMI